LYGGVPASVITASTSFVEINTRHLCRDRRRSTREPTDDQAVINGGARGAARDEVPCAEGPIMVSMAGLFRPW
jgi:hypothetical protein